METKNILSRVRVPTKRKNTKFNLIKQSTTEMWTLKKTQVPNSGSVYLN